MARNSYCGVDISTTALRMVAASHVDDEGFAVVDSFAIEPLADGVVAGGRIRRPRDVAIALARASKKVGAKKRSLVLGSVSTRAAVSSTTLPQMVKTRERVAALRTIEFQVSPSLPTHETVLSCEPISTFTDAKGVDRVQLSVAGLPREDVTALLEICRIAKVSPRAIDLSASGILRAMVRDGEESDDVSTIVDIGATTTRVLTRRGVHLVAVRSFANGGFDLTRAIASAAKESFDDAERRKVSMRLSSHAQMDQLTTRAAYAGLDEDDDEYVKKMNTQSQIERALSTAAEMLVDQIAQSVELDASMKGVSSHHLTLTGGGALMRGLKERLQRRLNVEVRIGHPWARLRRSRAHQQHFIGGKEDPKLMMELSTAIGLALWHG